MSTFLLLLPILLPLFIVPLLAYFTTLLLIYFVVGYLIIGFLVSCSISATPNVKEPDIIHVIYTFIIVLILWPFFISELFKE